MVSARQDLSSLTAADSALAELGLTPLECSVYRYLLAEPGATGYRVAQALGKPVGNIYKTVEALESKGAVATSDDEGNRTSAAIPVAEWLRARKSSFDRACTAAATALARAASDAGPAQPADDAVYRLTDREQVLERCRAMIATAKQFVIMTAAPSLVAEFAPALQRAAKRTPVALKVFQPVAIPGIEVIVDPRQEKAMENGPGAWTTINTDGSQCVCALFDLSGAELHSANWTRNPLVTWTHYTGLSSDLILAAVRSCMERGGSTKDIERLFKRLRPFENSASAGKLEMRRRYRGPTVRSSARTLPK